MCDTLVLALSLYLSVSVGIPCIICISVALPMRMHNTRALRTPHNCITFERASARAYNVGIHTIRPTCAHTQKSCPSPAGMPIIIRPYRCVKRTHYTAAAASMYTHFSVASRANACSLSMQRAVARIFMLISGTCMLCMLYGCECDHCEY